MVAVVVILSLLLPFFFLKKGKEMVADRFTQKYWFSHLKKMAEIYNFDLKLVLSLIIQESGGNEEATSSANAKGLMQIKEIVKQEYNESNYELVENLYDPIDNITVGMWYLKKMQDYYRNIFDALMAYSNGIGNYNKYRAGEKESLPHPEYARQVLARADTITFSEGVIT